MEQWRRKPRTPQIVLLPRDFPKGWKCLGDLDPRNFEIPEWVRYVYDHSEPNPRYAVSPHGDDNVGEIIRGKYYEYVILDNSDVYRRKRR